jgi:pimeloyl-ACP methyl ester carboxylesterase
MHPRLFASLILLEPVFDTSIHVCQGPALARASTFRQDVWASKGEAEAAARRKLKTWDERVLQRWLDFAYRALPTMVHPNVQVSMKKQNSVPFDVHDWLEKRWADSNDVMNSPEGVLHSSSGPPVTLTTTKHQEVFSYLRPNFDNILVASADNPCSPIKEVATSNTDLMKSQPLTNHHIPDIIGPENATTPFYRAEPVIAYQALPHLRPSVLYLFGDKSPLATPELRHAKLERTGVGISGSAKRGRVREIVVPLGTHLLPLEKVEECADAAARWLEDEVSKWMAAEDDIRQSWESRTGKEKASVSEKWVEKIRSML